MLLVKIVKASIRLNFYEAHKGLKAIQVPHFTSSMFGLLVLLLLSLLSPMYGAAIAQSNNSAAPAAKTSSTKKINVVMSASSSIAVDRFYGKALGLTRLPDENVENAYPIMRYQLENSDVISELHFVIAREKLPRLKGGAGVARGIRLLSLNFPQANKSDVIRRLHISGRNPILGARTLATGERYEFGTIVDADGNQVQLQFISDNMYAKGNDRFLVGLFVNDKKIFEKLVEQLASKLFCGAQDLEEKKESEAKTCAVKPDDVALQIFQAREGLEGWGAVPHKQIGYSLIQIQNDNISEKHRQFVQKNPALSVGKLTNTSVTGLTVKQAFLLTLSDGVLIEIFEP